VDYLIKYMPDGISVQHSHLPQQKALDMVGDALWQNNVHVHFDVGSKFNNVCKLTPLLQGQSACPAPGGAASDPYIVQGGAGGNAISESDSAVVCQDSGTLCQFPGQAATAWKGDFLYLRDIATVPGSNAPYFQSERTQSYRWALFGHFLG